MGSEPADVSQMCRDLLSTAVSEMGGQERPGQVAMAKAVDQAMRDKLHLLVQAGTGTESPSGTWLRPWSIASKKGHKSSSLPLRLPCRLSLPTRIFRPSLTHLRRFCLVGRGWQSSKDGTTIFACIRCGWFNPHQGTGCPRPRRRSRCRRRRRSGGRSSSGIYAGRRGCHVAGMGRKTG